MTTEQARALVDRLIEAAYDSGYYAGKNAKNSDGSYPSDPHREAMNLRNIIASNVVRLLATEGR